MVLVLVLVAPWWCWCWCRLEWLTHLVQKCGYRKLAIFGDSFDEVGRSIPGPLCVLYACPAIVPGSWPCHNRHTFVIWPHYANLAAAGTPP